MGISDFIRNSFPEKNCQEELLSKENMSTGIFFQRKNLQRKFCPKEKLPKECFSKEKCPKEIFSKEKMSKGTFFQRKNVQRNFFPKKKCQKKNFCPKIKLSTGIGQDNGHF